MYICISVSIKKQHLRRGPLVLVQGILQQIISVCDAEEHFNSSFVERIDPFTAIYDALDTFHCSFMDYLYNSNSTATSEVTVRTIAELD